MSKEQKQGNLGFLCTAVGATICDSEFLEIFSSSLEKVVYCRVKIGNYYGFFRVDSTQINEKKQLFEKVKGGLFEEIVGQLPSIAVSKDGSEIKAEITTDDFKFYFNSSGWVYQPPEEDKKLLLSEKEEYGVFPVGKEKVESGKPLVSLRVSQKIVA